MLNHLSEKRKYVFVCIQVHSAGVVPSEFVFIFKLLVKMLIICWCKASLCKTSGNTWVCWKVLGGPLPDARIIFLNLFTAFILQTLWCSFLKVLEYRAVCLHSGLSQQGSSH